MGRPNQHTVPMNRWRARLIPHNGGDSYHLYVQARGTEEARAKVIAHRHNADDMIIDIRTIAWKTGMKFVDSGVKTNV